LMINYSLQFQDTQWIPSTRISEKHTRHMIVKFMKEKVKILTEARGTWLSRYKGSLAFHQKEGWECGSSSKALPRKKVKDSVMIYSMCWKRKTIKQEFHIPAKIISKMKDKDIHK
jgi:hypothetical protein